MADILPFLVKRDVSRASGRPRIERRLQHDPGGVWADKAAENRAVDETMTLGVERLLDSHYSGHFWEAKVDSFQGVCTISIPVLLGENYKYIIKLKDMTPWAVIKAGGEILERFNIPRSNIDVAAFVKAREKRVTRARGSAPPG